MGIEALYRKANTSKPAPGHKIYPYLMRKLPITRPTQVWAMDLTYIPPLLECTRSPAGQRMARGFIFLASSALAFAISTIGVLIFAGLTSYDTQPIKSEYVAHAQHGDSE